MRRAVSSSAAAATSICNLSLPVQPLAGGYASAGGAQATPALAARSAKVPCSGSVSEPAAPSPTTRSVPRTASSHGGRGSGPVAKPSSVTTSLIDRLARRCGPASSNSATPCNDRRVCAYATRDATARSASARSPPAWGVEWDTDACVTEDAAAGAEDAADGVAADPRAAIRVGLAVVVDVGDSVTAAAEPAVGAGATGATGAGDAAAGVAAGAGGVRSTVRAG